MPGAGWRARLQLLEAAGGPRGESGRERIEREPLDAGNFVALCGRGPIKIARNEDGEVVCLVVVKGGVEPEEGEVAEGGAGLFAGFAAGSFFECLAFVDAAPGEEPSRAVGVLDEEDMVIAQEDHACAERYRVEEAPAKAFALPGGAAGGAPGRKDPTAYSVGGHGFMVGPAQLTRNGGGARAGVLCLHDDRARTL